MPKIDYVWLEKLLDAKLLPWQKELLEALMSETKIVIYTGRRCGRSLVEKAYRILNEI